MVTQKELIDKAITNAIDLLIGPITGYSYKEFADIAIKQYIKLKDMENTKINLMDKILDLSCSDLTDLLRGLNMILKESHISQRELFNKFGSCLFVTKDKSVNMLVDKNDKFIYVINEGDEVTIYGYKSKADILKAVGLTNEVVNTSKNEIVELIEKIKNTPNGTCGINNINNTKRDHLGCKYEKKICNHNGECNTCPTAKKYNHPYKEVNESDIEKVVQEEYTESKHDCGDKFYHTPINKCVWIDTSNYKNNGSVTINNCGDIPQTLEEVDKWAKNQKVDIFGDIHTHPEIDDPVIKHLCNVYGASNWYEAFANKFNQELDEENKKILQHIKDKETASKSTDEDTDEGGGKGSDEGRDEGLLSSHATTPTTPTTNTAHSSHLHHSSNGHLLKVTKKYPHRINQLQLLHNKHKIQRLSKIELTQGVSILECDIIWNDDVWSDEHIIPYNVVVYEGELAKDVDSEVGFQFYSFDEMYDYLEWKPNQDFTIVRIRDYYTTINK